MDNKKTAGILEIITEYCLYGILLSIPISIAGVEIFSVTAIIAFVIMKALHPDFRFIKDRRGICLFLFLFVVFIGLSLFNSGPYLAKSIRAFFSKWLEYIFVFIIAADILRKPSRIRNAVIVIVFAAALSALSGLSQYFFGFEFLCGRQMIPIHDYTFAVTAGFKHYNDFASYLIVIIPIVMALSFMDLKNKLYKAGIIFLLVLLLYLLLLTFSRGAWLGFFVGGVLFMILLKKYKLGLPCAGLLISFFILLPKLRERILYTIGGEGDSLRFSVWQGTWTMIKENPFLGKGLGTYMDYFSQYVKELSIRYAHNCYLQIWAETGVFALISFILFICALLYIGIKTAKKGLPDNLSILLVGIICGIIGFLTHSFFDTQLYSLQQRALFWVMSGLSLAIGSVLSDYS